MARPTMYLTIGVDDTGQEAVQNILAKSLYRDRVTLTAAIIERDNVSAFTEDWRNLIGELAQTFELDEIHASKLVNSSIPLRVSIGKAKAKELQWNGWLKALALLEKHDLYFSAQTAHTQTLTNLRTELLSKNSEDAKAVAERFDQSLGSLKRAAWLLLTNRIAQALTDNVDGAADVRLAVDWQIDRSTDFDKLEPELERLSAAEYFMWNVRFAPSERSCLIQAADCAGYVLNRHQLLLATRSLQDAGKRKKDVEFFKSSEGVASRFINTFQARVHPQDLHYQTYDNLVLSAIDLHKRQ